VDRLTESFSLTGRILLGGLLVDAGLLTWEKLDKFLAEQRRTNELLGAVLVRWGMLDRADLETTLALQKELTSAEDAIALASGVRKMLGEQLIKACRITRDELDEALSEQRTSGERLGDVLVRRGLITARKLETALAFQQRQASGHADPPRVRLSELLVAGGHLRRSRLEAALARQRHSGKKIGEILLEEGYVGPSALHWAFRLQEGLTKAALIAALSLASLSAGGLPEAEAAHRSSQFQVFAIVRSHAAITVLNQPSALVITAADVRRGFLDIEASTRIELRNNNPSGFLVIFTSRGFPYQEVSVTGLGREVTIGPNGGMFILTATGRSEATLTYRFLLSKDTRPGTYAWPLSISASAI
jgi:hypothetical protein